MSNYTKTTDFAAKDSLPTGDAGKIIRGAEFGTEFDNIATAIATKADTAGPTLTGTTTFDTLSDGTIAVTAFVDEDDMSSDSATMLPTQQSVKAYVDSQTTAQDLDFEADTGGPLSIDLDSETLTFTGGTGIDTSGVDNAVTFAIDNTVTTLTDTQTLTNKTLTSPTLTGTTLTGTTLLADLIVNNRQVATDDASGVNIDGNDVTVRGGASTGTGAGGSLVFQTTPADVAGSLVNTFSTVMTLDESGIDVAGEVEFDSLSGTGAVSVTDILDEDDMTSDSDTSLATQQSIKAYVDSQVAGADSLAEVLTNGNTTDGTDIAVGTGDDITFADSSKAIFGAGSDLQIYHDPENGSYVSDQGVGSLNLLGSTYIRIKDATDSNTAAEFNPTGASAFFYNNAQKLATTNTGIDITGTATIDGLTVNSGSTNTVATFQSTDTTVVIPLIDSVGSTQIRSIDGEFAIRTGGDGGSSANTVEAMRIDSSGNLQLSGSTDNIIRSGSDSSRVRIFGGSTESVANGAALTLQGVNHSGGNYVDLASASGGYINFRNGTSNAMRISSNGLVGIGTDDPQALTHIYTESAINTADTLLKLTNVANTARYVGFQAQRDNASGQGLNVLITKTDASVVNALTIDTSANVGIGTDLPAEPLHVQEGSSGITSKAGTVALIEGSANTKVSIASGTTSTGELLFGSSADNDAGRVIYDHSDDGLQLWTNGARAVDIDSSGNLLLNGTNATAKLVVDGAANAYTARFNSGTTTGQAFGTRVRAGTNSSDYALLVENTSAASMLAVRGDGNVGIGTSSPNAPLEVSGAATTSTDIAHFSNSNGVQKAVIGIDGEGDGQITLIDAGNNTDVLFTAGGVSYINTGGNFGLGTSSPQASIHTTGDAIIGTTTSGASYEGVLQIADGAVNERTVVLIYNNHPDQFMKLGQDVNTAFIGRDQADEFAIGVFDNAADTTLAKQFVIDASGNVLIGKSNAAISEAGTALLSTGTHNVTADGDTTLQLNRLSSDGAIATFFKDGTTVGSIGTEVADGTTPADLVITAGTINASRLWLKGGDSGLILDGHTNSVLPTDENSYEDNRTDLGNSDYRFKDLYLSGGVVFGATGGNVSSKTLDDYEEGSFSPVLADATTGGNASSTGAEAFYTKIGQQVFLTINFYNINTTGLTSGNDIFIQALPFVAKSISGAAYYTGTMYSSVLSFTRTENCYPLINDNESYLRLGFNRDGAGFDGQQVNGITSGSTDMTFNISYMTA